MSEETPEIAEFDPSASMTPETFSFFDVLEEITYPKEVKTIWTDEAAVYEFRKIANEIDDIIVGTPEGEEPDLPTDIQARLERIQDRIERSKFTFHLTGVSDDRIEEAAEIANAEFEDKKLQRKTATQAIEKYLPESQQLAYVKFFNSVVNSLHIEKIVSHRDGREMVAPSPQEVQHFFDKCPSAPKVELVEAIKALRVQSSNYERQLDEGFFPKS